MTDPFLQAIEIIRANPRAPVTKLLDGSRPGLPKWQALFHRKKTDRRLAALYEAALADRGDINNHFDDAAFDKVLSFIRDNPECSIRSLLDDVADGLPPRRIVYHRKKVDPVFAARLDAIIQDRQRRKDRKFSAGIARAVALIEDGATVLDIKAKTDLPSLTAIYVYADKYPWFRHRLNGAITKRRNLASAEYHQRQAREFANNIEQWLRQIENGKTIGAVLEGASVSRASFRRLVDASPDIRRQFYLARRSAASERARTRIYIPAAAPENHLKSLRKNDLYLAADRVLPRGLDGREDILSDVIAAVLSGEVPAGEIKQYAAKYQRAHRKNFSQYRYESMERMAFDGGRVSIGDMMSTGTGYLY